MKGGVRKKVLFLKTIQSCVAAQTKLKLLRFHIFSTRQEKKLIISLCRCAGNETKDNSTILEMI